MSSGASSPGVVFQAYLDAFAARDINAMRRCLADRDFYYRSPVSEYHDANSFVSDIWRICQILDGIDTRRIFVDGDEVCGILTFRIRINVVTPTPVVLWARVEAGRIQRLEAFFDATEYTQMFPDLNEL